MISKKTSALLGSLLLLAAVVPLATAHLSSSSTTSQLHSTRASDLNGDPYRWSGNVPSAHSGVSGSYINNPQNLFLTGGKILPLTIPDPTGVVGPVALFPLGYSSGASAFCDLEVLSPGNGPGDAERILDETNVDQSNPSGGVVPDGTWDDGGIGGACHTETQYADPLYNTPGCGTGGTHAVAEDLVSDRDVWIGAGCDQTTAIGGSPTGVQCLINEIISGANPAVLVKCVTDLVNNVPAPMVICGPDSITDTINYGPGGGDGSAFGVPYPASGCPGGSAVVYTFNYVSLGGNPCHNWLGQPPCHPTVIPATAGWIDSRDLASYVPTFGPGYTVGYIPQCLSLDDEDMANDGAIWLLDAECHHPLDDDESA